MSNRFQITPREAIAMIILGFNPAALQSKTATKAELAKLHQAMMADPNGFDEAVAQRFEALGLILENNGAAQEDGPSKNHNVNKIVGEDGGPQ